MGKIHHCKILQLFVCLKLSQNSRSSESWTIYVLDLDTLPLTQLSLLT